MIKQFADLSAQEMELLLKAPALVSVLAASGDEKIGDDEKADAVKRAQVATFGSKPILREYYTAVENGFENNFEAIVREYAPFDEAKREALKEEINKLNLIIDRLDTDFAIALHESLKHYADDVNKAHRSILENVIFPFPLPGITD